MSHLINIFVDPAKVFADLKEKPSFLVPALVAFALAALSMVLYHQHVDPQWFLDHRDQVMAGQMSKADIEQARAFLPGARMSGWVAVVMIAVVTLVVYPLVALFYLLAGKILGHAVGFRRGLALTAWAAMPMVLASVVLIVGTYTNSPQTSLESLQLFSIDPLLVSLPMDHAWSTVAKSASLLILWVVFLAALGWKTWFRTGWGQALAVAATPWLLYFGALSLGALF